MMGIQLPFQFTFPYSDILVLILSTILLLYGGKPFYQGALDEFKAKEPGMMALVSLGITVSYIYSVLVVIGRYLWNSDGMDFFFEFASLILIMLLGHWIEMKALGEAGDAQLSLAKLIPKDAQVLAKDDTIHIKPVSELQIGDVIRVQAGERVPADGSIIRGSSRINESLLTGESKEVEKSVGDLVIGGSINGPQALFVQVKEIGERSFISQVQKLIRDANSQTSRAENMAQKVAGLLFYIAVTVAVLAFIIWLFISGIETATLFTVTTLVIACPHALGLAIPLVVARSTSLGANQGLLVKNRDSLERTTKADVLVLDKTGTLTSGEFKVLDVKSFTKDYNETELLALLAGIEGGSSHPIANSIVSYAKSKSVTPYTFEALEVISGSGVRGRLNEKDYRLISLKAYGVDIDANVPLGATASVLVEGDTLLALVTLGDELKASSTRFIHAVKELGIDVIMATGDNEQAAKGVADMLGISYLSNQTPEDKYHLIQRLKEEGKTVIMVGDGINDAPSLALADVGIAIGAGTEVALDSADVVLTRSEPGDILSFIELSRKTSNKMKQNLAWGAGYNFLAIPLAAGILAPLGITITPAVGAILMSLSTIIVAINAMFLRLDPKRLQP